MGGWSSYWSWGWGGSDRGWREVRRERLLISRCSLLDSPSRLTTRLISHLHPHYQLSISVNLRYNVVMKTTFLVSLICIMLCPVLFSRPVPVAANDEEGTIYVVTVDLPDVGISYSSLWYPVKRKWEDFKGWFIFNPQKKAEYYMELSEKRLNEMYQESVQGNTDAISGLEQDFMGHLAEVSQQSKKIKNEDELEDLAKSLISMQLNHEELFGTVISEAPQSVDNILADVQESIFNELTRLIEEILKME